MKIYYDNKGFVAPTGIELGDYIEVDSLPEYDEDKFEYLVVINGKVVVEVCEEALTSSLLIESKEYLSTTDWYMARKVETGEEVPSDVAIKRTEAREFIRSQEDV